MKGIHLDPKDKIVLGNLSLDVRDISHRLSRVNTAHRPVTREELTELRDMLNVAAETVQIIRDRNFQ